MMRVYLDNDEGLSCPHCGDTPTYLDLDGERIMCEACDGIIEEADPDTEPDPVTASFYRSNHYDISTAHWRR